MNYKLIAMDFDGTLLTSEKKVTSYTKEVLLNYKEKGYIIVGVTARNLESVKNILDINIFNYLILNNGSYVYDVKNNKGNQKGIISKEDYYNLTEELKEFSNGFDFCSTNSYYSYKHKVINQRAFIRNINNVEEINEEIVRMNIHIIETEKVNYCCDLINNKYKRLNCFIMEVSDSKLKLLGISPKGINKGVTLKELGQELNVDLSEMIFFGDSSNDLEAIKIVGCSVAMDNALDQIKETAKHTTLSNNEDGIAVFLESFIKE